MSKAFLFGLVVGVGLLAVVAVGTARLQSRDADKEERTRYQAELEDATPVWLGALTQRQRVHSNLYTSYQQRNNGKTVTEFMELAKKTGNIVEIEFCVPLSPLLTEPQTPESYFGEIAHDSDAVIRGRVANKVSQITADEGFVFTDYTVVVTEVLKNNVSDPIDVSETILVTRPGGKVVLDGVIVKGSDDCFAPLSVKQEVVLFLQFVRESGAYQPTRYSGSFEIDGSQLKPLTKTDFPPGVIRDADSFLRAARAVSKR